MAAADYETLGDDDPHYTVVGLVASLWAFLEATIDGVISELANTDEQSMACVTAQLIGPAKRMDALIALFLFRGGSEKLKSELKTFQGQIQQLGEDRNRIVHDALLKEKATGKIFKALVTAKGSLRYGFAPVDIEAMKKTATEIRTKLYEFMDFKKKIDAEMLDILEAQLKRIGVTPTFRNPPNDKT